MPRSPREGGSSTSGGQHNFAQNPPLVIVNELGRHDEASRRVVRAQAARASAAQSRITRARNRDQREGRGELLSFGEQVVSMGSQEASTPSAVMPSEIAGKAPLLSWLGAAPGAAGVTEGTLEQAASALSSARSPSVPEPGGSPFQSLFQNFGGDSGRQLPLAVPRGFATLKQKVDISTEFLTLISRTACFDFGSPGVESRLHQLLLDLILSSAGGRIIGAIVPGHAIQGHLRIACTCLTIFQGQRADGQKFAGDPKYNAGLTAAWSEVSMMDQGALAEPKTAQASIWAIIISVTTGAGAAASIFHQLLHTLFQDLGVQGWEHVRSILLDFIFPVSFLDEPCKRFFQGLQDLRIGLV
jgi:hypothetical protein